MEEEGEKIENLHVRKVDRNLWDKFKAVAVAKTGKLHGVLGQELEEALLLYLEKHENVRGGKPSLA